MWLRRLFFMVLLCLLSVKLIFSSETLDRLLILAISKGDFPKVKKLVEEGANVNYRYHKGKSTLHWAVSGGNFKIVAYLILKGANVEAKDDNGCTPLQYAAMSRNLDIVKLLIQSGANPWHIDRSGWSVMHHFVYYEFEIGIKYLLTLGVLSTNSSTRKYLDIPAGFTPLDIAYKKQLYNIVNVLENPYKYLALSKKPVLFYGVSLDLLEEESISPYERGKIIIYFTNAGGENIYNLSLELIPLSNVSGIDFEKEKRIINLPSQSTDYVEFELKGNKEIQKDEMAFFKLLFYYGEYTNSLNLKIKKKFKEIPQPEIYAIFQQPFEFEEFSITNIVFRIENKGKGELKKALFSIEIPENILLTNRYTFDISLKAGEITDLSLPVVLKEDLKAEIFGKKFYGKTIFSSPYEDKTNYFAFVIKRKKFPEFEVFIDTEDKTSQKIFLGNPTSNFINIIITNKSEVEAENLNLVTWVFSFQTNEYKFNIKKFPPFQVLKLSLPFEEDEKSKSLLIDLSYKTKDILLTNLNLTNISLLEREQVILTNGKRVENEKTD